MLAGAAYLPGAMAGYLALLLVVRVGLGLVRGVAECGCHIAWRLRQASEAAV